jgi:RHS repeat-associated protein
MEAKSNTASGMPVCLWRNGIRSRSSGKERDAETGLDYFGARYYSGAQGRFTSSDPGNAGASLDDPQSWNAYAYSHNNPLNYTDPTGMEYRVCAPTGSCQNYPDQDFSRNYVEGKGVMLVGEKDRGDIFKDGRFVGHYEHLHDDPWYVDADRWISNLLEYGSKSIEEQKEEDWYQGRYLGWAIDKAAGLILPANKTEAALAMVPVGKFIKGGKIVKKELAAAEKTAVAMAKRIQRDLGPAARRIFHDMKVGGDRTLQVLKEHAAEVYELFGKTPPKWMRP